MTAKSMVAIKTSAMVALVALTVAACSNQTFREGAESHIGGSYADNNGLDLDDVTCDEPASDTIGTTFACVGMQNDRQAEFVVEIDGEDHFVARSVNVVHLEAVDRVEATIVESLNQQGSFGLAADAIDCGEQAVVLSPDSTFVCGLSEPETGNIFDTTVRMHDLATVTFDFELASAPRNAG